MEQIRSWMFVPGHRQKMIDKALGLNADAIMLDIEDGVAPNEKDAARKNIGDSLGRAKAPGTPARYVRINAIGHARMDADLHFALHLKQNYSELKPDQADKIAAHDVYQLVASNPHQPPLRLYFDQESGLLLRLVRYADSPLGLNPTRIDFEAYSAVDGVQVPHRWTVARPSGQFTIQAKEIRQNVPVSDDKFVKPAASPPPPAQ